MTHRPTPRAAARNPLLRLAIEIAVALLAFFTLTFGAQAAVDKASPLSKEDLACLDCHAKPAVAKAAGGAEERTRPISARGFGESVHGSSGCDGCHSDLDVATHATQARPASSRRDQAVAMMDTCRNCHKKTVKQYQDSVHVALLQAGSDKAPLCSDCHDPHTQHSAKDPSAHAEGVVCQKCHEGIVTAHNASVHGSSGDSLQCADCHRTHDVKAASLGNALKTQCLSCHRDTVASHKEWLPNTERHLDAVSCPACHSPGATRRVNLRLYDRVAGAQATQAVGVPQFVKLASSADANGTGLDARALWSLLQEFNRGEPQNKTVLRGRLEVTTGVQAHQLADKSLALKDCDTCHRQGAASFQSVTITMAGPDGRPLRHAARNGVLTSVESIEAVGGFYTIGSTRIKLLDQLLLLTLAAGICIPLAHLSAKWLTRKSRAQHAAAAAPTEAAPPAAASDDQAPRN